MPIDIFCCYAREDEELLNKLKRNLMLLQNNGHINLKHDRDISAGVEWKHAIDEYLNTAHIILLLISPDFLASDYCYGIEMKRALERHRRNEARVIPIILRPAYWQEIKELAPPQALPKDGLPIVGSGWQHQDEAFLDVVRGVHKSADEVNARLLKVGADFAITKPKEDAIHSPMLSDDHRQKTIHALLCQLVKDQPELEADICDPTIVRFGVKIWDIPALKAGKKWPSSGRILLFTIEDKRQLLNLELGLGWGPEGTDTREKLFRMALFNEPPFLPAHYQQLPAQWVHLYRRKMLRPEQYNQLSDEALEAAIRKEWSFFMEDTLPQLDAVLKQQEWFR